MKPKGYAALGAILVSSMLLIVAAAQGWLRDDSGEDPAALLVLAVIALGWLAFVHFMHESAEQERERFGASSGSEPVFSDGWRGRWTLRGAAFGAASLGLLLVVACLSGDISLPSRGDALGIAVLVGLLAEVVVAFAFGIVARRAIRFVEDLHLRRVRAEQEDSSSPA